MNSLRRFFLAQTPEQGQPELLASDCEHALRVLRVRAGERLLGLDGCGRAWELEVLAADRRRLELSPSGPVHEESAPGSPPALRPWIEVACPLPKLGRAEDMLDRLTQLGLSRLVPLVTERSGSQARGAGEGRIERLERTARESLKQCGRLWLPEIAHPAGLDSLLGNPDGPTKKPGVRLLLDPTAPQTLGQVLAASRDWAAGTRAEPLVLVAGPEGGFSPRELEDLLASGARRARVGPHILRIETAVEAALAIAVDASAK